MPRSSAWLAVAGVLVASTINIALAFMARREEKKHITSVTLMRDERGVIKTSGGDVFQHKESKKIAEKLSLSPSTAFFYRSDFVSLEVGAGVLWSSDVLSDVAFYSTLVSAGLSLLALGVTYNAADDKRVIALNAAPATVLLLLSVVFFILLQRDTSSQSTRRAHASASVVLCFATMVAAACSPSIPQTTSYEQIQ